MELLARCIDAGTAYCPCKLAEAGQCLVCQHCRREDFCACSGTAGFCVYQELKNNGMKARGFRKTHLCEIEEISEFDGNLLYFKVKIPHQLALDLRKIGSFVFVRAGENPHFDLPAAVFFSDEKNDTFGFALTVMGVKTMELSGLKAGDSILVRGPFWNGVLGIKNIAHTRDEKALVLASGIGLIPSLSVIKSLKSQGNALWAFLDEGKVSRKFLDFVQKTHGVSLKNCAIGTEGGLAPDAKTAIQKALNAGITLIHIGLSDFLISKVAELLKELKRTDVKLSCINSAKMVCGEGVCGACTGNVSKSRIRRLCKEQIDPWELSGKDAL